MSEEIVETREISAVSRMPEIIDPNVNYKLDKVMYGKYKDVLFYPQEGNSGQTIDVGGGQAHNIVIGGNYFFNWARSKVDFQVVTVTGAATNNNWTYADSLAYLRDVQLQPNSGSYIVNTLGQHKFYKGSKRYLTEYEKYKSYPSTQPFYPSRTLQSDNKQSIATVAPAASNNAPVNFDEPQLCLTNTNGNTANGANVNPSTAMMIHSIPLSYFAGCELAVNRTIGYMQDVKLIFTYEGIQKWLWNSTSTTDPSAGAGNSATTAVNIQCVLRLAVEQDPEVIAELRSQILGGGLRVQTPFISRVYYQPLNSSNQSFNVILNRSHGKRLLRAWWIVFNGTESNNTMLDSCNYNQEKVQYYQTSMDGIPLQIAPMYSGGVASTTQKNFDDYEFLQWKMKGSCVFSMIDYMYNHFHVDDFTQPTQIADSEKDLPAVNKLDEGFPLDDGIQHNYMVNATTPSQLNSHTLCVETIKDMFIQPGAITVV